ncbi:ABC transporter ATP-binding protein [Paenibacillus sp. FSL M8-0334]|uniref:ATP-binding cassette domain-containing protein n=1 Tax=Paenibacillus campinasensis TaxID=66347 RepID=A0ABW9T3G1_9BACL|nr:ABC transporter ATP-binding protein [Paenibacillus campinasensis]MUG67622.1 ATP-binding cassette domain-containing protein [Paenibacillus campinasensis]
MSSVVFNHVTKYFGENKAVNDAHFSIEEGEFFTLLGPSGCGKTTLLRTIAGFYRNEEGDIYFGDRVINDVPTHERNIGMVFQNYAIFPHLSVFDNVAYGLRARKMGKKEIETKVMEALEMVELSHLRDRIPSNMSGGQQQRIALARAIVIRPALLLMDEPLSNLDAKLRVKMRTDIRQLQKELNITTIYVTHDQEEALAVSDRIAVLNEGVIQQIATPQQIYQYPHNRFVANFIGTSNFVEGSCEKDPDSSGHAGIIQLLGTTRKLSLHKPYEGKVVFAIRPEQVHLSGEPASDHAVQGTVKSVSFLGDKVSYLITLPDGSVMDVHDYPGKSQHLFREKQSLFLDIQLERTVMYDSTGQEVIYHAGEA